MVLLILPLVWAAVLLPPWVRHVRERREDRSVDLFGRRMAALQRSSAIRYVFSSYDSYRTMPTLQTLRTEEHDHSYPPAVGDVHDHGYLDDAYRDGEATSGPAYRPRSALAPVQTFPAPQTPRYGVEHSVPRMPSAGSRAALRRRRQIFFTLLAAFLVTLGAVAVLRTPAALAAHALVLVAFLGYVNLLVRHHQRVEERSAKVRRLASEQPGQPARRPSVVVLGAGSGH